MVRTPFLLKVHDPEQDNDFVFVRQDFIMPWFHNVVLSAHHEMQLVSFFKRQAKTKAQDLAENGVEIELMHIGHSFDVSLFYRVSYEWYHLVCYVRQYSGDTHYV